MPALGINLLPKEKATPQQKKVVAKISMVLIGILVLYVFIVVGLFSYGAYQSMQNNNVVKETSDTESQIKSAQKKEILELALKTRIKEVNTLITSRTSYSDYLTKLQTLTPLGTNFEDLEFKKGMISAVGSSANVVTVNNFIDNLKKETMFSNILLGSLNRGKGGIYNFSLELSLVNETKN
jgi:Tfp pilus assembly protein PilN